MFNDTSATQLKENSAKKESNNEVVVVAAGQTVTTEQPTQENEEPAAAEEWTVSYDLHRVRTREYRRLSDTSKVGNSDDDPYL